MTGPNKRKQKVAIFGGGIAGLTLAHELSKTNEYEIEIYERNTELGGQARSKITQDGEHSEYCWHAVGAQGYVNFLKLLKEIQDDKGQLLINKLKPLKHFIYAGEGRPAYVEYNRAFLTGSNDEFIYGLEHLTHKRLSIKDKLSLMWLSFRAKSMCQERLKEYDYITWSEYTKHFKQHIRRWILDSTAIYLGMDYSKLNAHTMIHLLRQNKLCYILNSEQYTFYSFNGPMNRTFFDPWGDQLIKRGVKINTSTFLSGLTLTNDGAIKNATIGKNRGKFLVNEVVNADYYINAMDVSGFSKVAPPQLVERFNKLSELGNQIQTQVIYYIPYKLDLPEGTILTFHDSEWFIMARVEGGLWNTSNYDILACGIGIWDRASNYAPKALHCTRDELAEECWRQIYIASSYDKLKDKLPQETPEWNIWDSFEFEDNKMNTYEPKFSNNTGTLHLRLEQSADKNIPNLYHCGSAQCATKKNIFNMESAVEAGKNTAYEILYEKNRNVNDYEEPSLFIKVCRFIDHILWIIGL